MAEILASLLEVAEKAANIARVCRAEEALFRLLVEEKTGDDKNKKFLSDFKTLADVLIQEAIKHYVGKKFPGLAGHIYGEESNKFTNSLGETVYIEVRATPADTAELLTLVLDGNHQAARLLAEAVHSDSGLAPDPRLKDIAVKLEPEDLGVWVDPIDSTNQYIEGASDDKGRGGVFEHGLQCVTVLVGAYGRHDGLPIMGVVNQPFVRRDPQTGRWSGKGFWGLCYDGVRVSSIQGPPHSVDLSVVMSGSEGEHVRLAMGKLCGGDSERVRLVAGAGYKALCVAEGFVSAYVCTKPKTTYAWDSCAPHAVLRSLGGGVANLRRCMASYRQGVTERGEEGKEPPQLVYHQPFPNGKGAEMWANMDGFVAYRSPAVLQAALLALAECERT
ncbi:inositol polyphosphate 1-phosphatase [Petromyzon marinus]|uniref:inositol polyphosphate 1-phosphatase n=1 Tax=Petromyzon marinus TaxID=7757 RepID=UPI003F6E797E